MKCLEWCAFWCHYISSICLFIGSVFLLDLREIHWFWQGRKHGRRWWRPSSISTDYWQSLGAGFKVQLNYFLFCINENGPGLQKKYFRPFESASDKCSPAALIPGHTSSKPLLYGASSHDFTSTVLVSKTMNWRPCWCSKAILWELNLIMSKCSFVPINLRRCWTRDWKRSIQDRLM